MSRFVIDASVVLAWCFPDENSGLAESIARMFSQGDTAIAPSFWPHEVLNALLAGEKRKRISAELTQKFLGNLVKLPITLEHLPTVDVFNRVQWVSWKVSLTAYDAAYLELAHQGGLPLATLDQDLRRASLELGVDLVLENI